MFPGGRNRACRHRSIHAHRYLDGFGSPPGAHVRCLVRKVTRFSVLGGAPRYSVLMVDPTVSPLYLFHLSLSLPRQRNLRRIARRRPDVLPRNNDSKHNKKDSGGPKKRRSRDDQEGAHDVMACIFFYFVYVSPGSVFGFLCSFVLCPGYVSCASRGLFKYFP